MRTLCYFANGTQRMAMVQFFGHHRRCSDGHIRAGVDCTDVATWPDGIIVDDCWYEE